MPNLGLGEVLKCPEQPATSAMSVMHVSAPLLRDQLTEIERLIQTGAANTPDLQDPEFDLGVPFGPL